jgi:hypothetical protein
VVASHDRRHMTSHNENWTVGTLANNEYGAPD